MKMSGHPLFVCRDQRVHLRDLSVTCLDRLLSLINELAVDVFADGPSTRLKILQTRLSLNPLLFAPFVKIKHLAAHPRWSRDIRIGRHQQPRGQKLALIRDAHISADAHQMRFAQRARTELPGASQNFMRRAEVTHGDIPVRQSALQEINADRHCLSLHHRLQSIGLLHGWIAAKEPPRFRAPALSSKDGTGGAPDA